MATDRALYNANDGLTGRGGGPYLDLEEQRLAEQRRALIEGREPDYENPGASAGTVLFTAGQLLANAGVNNIPSNSAGPDDDSSELAVKSLADNPQTNLKAHAVLPADAFTPAPDSDDTSTRAALATDGSTPVGESNVPEDLPPTTSDAAAQPNVNQAQGVVTEQATVPEVAENAPAE